jgi:succinate-semialdehyde dehydrogenase/glutarate-semialdehyde dehydrogenase
MTHVKAVNWDILPVKRNLWWYPADETTYNTLLKAQRMMYPRDAKEFIGSAMGAAPRMVKKMFTKWKHK